MAGIDIAASWKALEKFMDGSGPRTKDDFQVWITEHPEVLTPEGIMAIEAIGATQIAPGTREDLRRLLELIQDCLRDGVQAGLASFERRHMTRQRDARSIRESERLRAERRTKTKVPWEEAPEAIRGWGTPFASLKKCADYLAGRFNGDKISIAGKAIKSHPDASDTLTLELPKYLFRGESGLYLQSRSSLDRLLTDTSLKIDTVEEILRVTLCVQRALETKWKLPSMLVQGFLQHYQLPTRYLDVTTDLDVAISFASDLPVGGLGAIAVLSTERLPRFGQLIDLRAHPFAPRPLRQRALAVFSSDHRNLKSPPTIDTLGLHWFTFMFTEADEEQFLPRPDLLDAHSDRAAGLIELIINGLGKMEDGAARWIADRLQPAPFTMKIAGDPTRFEWVSTDEAGIEYDARASRESNYRFWSKKFPVTEKKEPPPGLVETLGDIKLSPGAILRVVGPNGFELLAPDFLDLV
jgi:hypothetical protein